MCSALTLHPLQAEHLINVLANKAASEAVAPFLGYALVETPVGAGTAWHLACGRLAGWCSAKRVEGVQAAVERPLLGAA